MTSDNLADQLSLQAAARPGSPAVILDFATLGFAQLDALVWRCATRLVLAGFGRGRVATVILGDELLLLVVTLACARIGATCLTIAPDTPDLLLDEILGATHSDVLILPPVDVGRTSRVRVIPADRRALLSPVAIDAGVRVARPDAPWLIVVGSGSTGRSKYFAIDHGRFGHCLRLCTESLSITGEDRYASMMHLLHSSPKERGLATLFERGALVLPDRRRRGIGAMLTRFGVTILEATVVHADALLRAPAERPETFGGLRVLLLTASTVGEALRHRIVSGLTPNLWVRYGTNETGLITMCRSDELFAAPGTVGRRHPGVDVEVIGPDGERLPPGRTGEVRVRSPALIFGYLGDPEATRRAFRDGWFHPGDLGEFTEDGFLVFQGRADQMMIFNGNNIYPAHIESVVTSHPAVRDAAAFPLASEGSQDVPVCAVALNPGEQLGEAELRAFCHERLGYRTPLRFFFVGRIPRNAQGKLARAEMFGEIKAAGAQPALLPADRNENRSR